MKRIATLNALTVMFFILGAATVNCAAQEATCPPYQKTPPRRFEGPPKWENLKTGEGQLFRLWKAEGAPAYPQNSQAGILRLTAATYRQFQQDPVKFINENEIFECDVRKIVGRGLVTPRPDAGKAGGTKAAKPGAQKFVADAMANPQAAPAGGRPGGRITMYYVMLDHDNTSEGAFAALGELPAMAPKPPGSD